MVETKIVKFNKRGKIIAWIIGSIMGAGIAGAGVALVAEQVSPGSTKRFFESIGFRSKEVDPELIHKAEQEITDILNRKFVSENENEEEEKEFREQQLADLEKIRDQSEWTPAQKIAWKNKESEAKTKITELRLELEEAMTEQINKYVELRIWKSREEFEQELPSLLPLTIPGRWYEIGEKYKGKNDPASQLFDWYQELLEKWDKEVFLDFPNTKEAFGNHWGEVLAELRKITSLSLFARKKDGSLSWMKQRLTLKNKKSLLEKNEKEKRHICKIIEEFVKTKFNPALKEQLEQFPTTLISLPNLNQWAKKYLCIFLAAKRLISTGEPYWDEYYCELSCEYQEKKLATASSGEEIISLALTFNLDPKDNSADQKKPLNPEKEKIKISKETYDNLSGLYSRIRWKIDETEAPELERVINWLSLFIDWEPTEEMKEPTAGEKAKESDEKKETSPSPENLGEILDSKVETLAEIVKNRLPSFDAKFYHIYKEDKDKVKKAFDSEKTFLIVLNSIIKEADSWSDKELETAVGNLEPIEDVYDEEEMLRSLEGLPDKETPLDNLADDE